MLFRSLRSHAGELHIGCERIALLGRSAGGHLSLLVAYTSCDVRAVVALYTPTELPSLYAAKRQLRDNLNALGNWADASPIDRLHTGVPPTLLVHGEWDELVPISQSERLANAHDRVELLRVPCARHAFDHVLGSPAEQLARQAVVTFLKQQLG